MSNEVDQQRLLNIGQVQYWGIVLLSNPSWLSDKPAGLYRGPIITAIKRSVFFDRNQSFHQSIIYLRGFQHPEKITIDEAAALAATDSDVLHVESIINHEGDVKDPKE